MFLINFANTLFGFISILAEIIFKTYFSFCNYFWEIRLTPELGIKYASQSNKKVVVLVWSLHSSLISPIP